MVKSFSCTPLDVDALIKSITFSLKYRALKLAILTNNVVFDSLVTLPVLRVGFSKQRMVENKFKLFTCHFHPFFFRLDCTGVGNCVAFTSAL